MGGAYSPYKLMDLVCGLQVPVIYEYIGSQKRNNMTHAGRSGFAEDHALRY